jgi:hypothetical protein
MRPRFRTTLLLVLFSYLSPYLSSVARGDGGVVRLHERTGAYQVTVFTSPTPLRAGQVDVSVLVQDAAGEFVPEAQVTVRLTSPGSGAVLQFLATSEAATNKLFRAAVFDLPAPGRWDVEIEVEGPQGSARLRLGVEADGPPPRWLELWPWFTWPGLVVAMFGVHQVLVRRRKSPPGNLKTGELVAGRHSR